MNETPTPVDHINDVLTWTHAALAAMRREDLTAAFDAMERAQHAAFEAKQAVKDKAHVSIP